MNNSEQIYFDYAATTPVAAEVKEAMEPFFGEKYGNPSSLYSLGREAKREALEKSREDIADYLGVEPKEIIFTSCATESNNLAIKGSSFAEEGKPHLITSKIEHHAVLHSFEWLEDRGYEVTYLDVNEDGLVDPADLKSAIRDDTSLVSVMYANNEIGTIEPVSELAGICKENGVKFHTDAVQAFGKFPLEIEDVDMLSASGHKIYGPKGVGFLYVRDGVDLEPILSGGGHENGLRSGTENTAGIVGLAAATELMAEDGKEESRRQEKLRDKIIDGCLQMPDTRLNGHPDNRLPNNVNISFGHVEGESIVMGLDREGFATSTGSACSSPNLEPSHVLLATGIPLSLAHGSLRVSLGRYTKEEDVDSFLEKLTEVIKNLREASPI